MNNYLKFIKLLGKELEFQHLLKSVNPVKQFYDEPKYHGYFTRLRHSSVYKRKSYSLNGNSDDYIGSGGSFFYPQLALLKSISESIERYFQFCFKKNRIIVSTYNRILGSRLNPQLYIKDIPLTKNIFGWVKGTSLSSGKSVFILAQLAFLGHYHFMKYDKNINEIVLTPPVSTGAAAGFNHEETLLRGIYEVIERDAFMTIYLNKISPPRVVLKSIKSIKVQSIIETLLKYKLEPYVYSIINDLEVPSFLTIIVDRTGRGPALTAGIKSGFNAVSTIIGSLEEAYMPRPGIRSLIASFPDFYSKMNIKSNEIDTHQKRVMFWYPQKSLENIHFILYSARKAQINSKHFKNGKEELRFLINKLKKLGFDIFSVDITPPRFKSFGFRIYKIIIPGMQPLYLNEKYRKIIKNRLLKVAKYFHKQTITLNNFPHPIL